MTRKLERNPSSSRVIMRRRGPSFMRTITNFVNDVISLPFRLGSWVLGGFVPSVLSLATFGNRRGGVLGFLSFPSKLFTFIMVIWLVVDPYVISKMDPSWSSGMTYTLIAAASIAVITSLYGCLRTMMVCAFWLLAAFVVGNAVYKVKPGSKKAPVLVASKSSTLPVELEYYDIPGQALESLESGATAYLPDLGGIYNSIQAGISSNVSSIGDGVVDRVTDNISSLAGISGLNAPPSVTEVSDSLGFSSGSLPDSAFFPPVAKTKGFYPIRARSSGTADTIKGILGGLGK